MSPETAAATQYDTFLYPSASYPQTHPDRLATISRLFGLQTAAVEQARVLEIGCGDGTNLINMALSLPQSRFLGLDLAAAPVRKGNQMRSALGLANVRLEQMDLMQVPADLGQFDFIIAHGLYSWVPAEVREKLLAVCHDHLAPGGVAYISYNAYPGNHLRDLARRMMRFHVRQFKDPPDQIRQARTLLKFLAEAKVKTGPWQDVLRQQFDRIQHYVDAGFYHDDLSAVNQPFYFYEFVEAAGRHQLQFLSEADFFDMQVAGLTEEASQIIAKVEECNLIAREQYLDFVEGRSFRQTLLCHQDQELDRALKPERLHELFIATEAKPARPEADLTGPAVEDFQKAKAVIATGHPVLKCALAVLGEAWPRALPFAELLARARSRAGRGNNDDPAQRKADTHDLGEFLLRCYTINFVELHACPSPFITDLSPRPVASPLARLQAQAGPVVVSLRHLTLKIEDRLGVILLGLLDGTRDRAALVDELSRAVLAGRVSLVRDGQPVTDPGEVRESVKVGLENSLRALAKLGLLVA